MKLFFKSLLKSHGGEPGRIITDKLRSYGVAHRQLMPDVVHDTSQSVPSKLQVPSKVRRPIYASSVNLWRNYERHLDELIETLEPVLAELPAIDQSSDER